VDIPSAFMAAVKEANSGIVPFKTFGTVLADAGKVTYEEQLGYSIVHIKADGKPATDLKSCAFVSMPHVIARGNDKRLTVPMKTAGFTKEGLCKGRNDIAARQAEAARLAGLLWGMFGTAPAPKAKVAKAPAVVQAPEEVATAE
jgi:hypothetical protein